MKRGRIKFWNVQKEFGFIMPEHGGEDIYFNKQGCSSIEGLVSGAQVEYRTVKTGDNKTRATGVQCLNLNRAAKPADKPDTAQSRLSKTNPYHFVGLDVRQAVTDTPVWHDGGNSLELLSGEMHITLTALTPLLVGQWQLKAQEITDAQLEPVEVTDEKGNVTTVERCRLPFFETPVDKEKNILEPLRLDDGRVVLPGASLKGMLRHSLGALLSAPMERVAERSYSYRPNARFQPSEHFRKVRPALIESAAGGKITIRVLPEALSVWFGRYGDLGKPAYDKTQKAWPGIGKVKPYIDRNGNTVQKQRFKRKSEKESLKPLGLCRFAHYDGGIDGQGILCKTFKSSAETYDAVLIPEQDYDKGNDMELPASVVKHYEKTLEHLLDGNGLLAPGYPNGTENDYKKARKAIEKLKSRWQRKEAKELAGRLIYVELEKNGSGKDIIVSMGHHYYYRWRYTDTVRSVRHDPDQWRVRDILAPLPEESTDGKSRESIPPKQLSAARLLFGYTSRREQKILDRYGNANIGSGDFQRLAGRIQINSAVERLNNGENGKTDARFLTEGTALALQPLGQPRPSAVEHYLAQPSDTNTLKAARKDGGHLLTYGDSAVSPRGDKPGKLAGRKFYPHQPDAAFDPAVYTAQTEAHVAGKQAALARFVSKPQTDFRFTLRFKDLRSWELGALLAVLEPEKSLPDVLKSLTARHSQQSGLDGVLHKMEVFPKSSPAGKPPLFAHKLGHARPLGFGSVGLTIDRRYLLTANAEDGLPAFEPIDDERKTQALEDFAGKLKPSETIANWCAVHQYAGRSRSAYPRERGDIFKHHSKIRTNHIAARRLEEKQGKLSDGVLPPLPFDPDVT